MKEWKYAAGAWAAAALVAMASSRSVPRSVLLAVLLLAVFRLLFASERFRVLWRAWLIGLGSGVGLTLLENGGVLLSQFGLYLTVLSMFHVSEFIFTTFVAPENAPVSTDSFLLNHSKEYGLAALAAVIEFVLEAVLLKSWKANSAVMTLGLALCLGGEVIRKLAILTAGSNFNHIVQMEKKEGHELVTSGIYSLCRHPSYLGWFVWSFGTQLILVNPLCAIAYLLASWKFFQARILEEEYALLYFFGDSYRSYQKTVPSGVPLVRGFVYDHPALQRCD